MSNYLATAGRENSLLAGRSLRQKLLPAQRGESRERLKRAGRMNVFLNVETSDCALYAMESIVNELLFKEFNSLPFSVHKVSGNP